jgi:uncharacterized protein (DUF3084 family)
MTYDVSQWLAEIKTLKQKLAEATQEREEAHASASNWRQLYETEAQQRRSEFHLAQQTIDQLKQQLQQLQARLSPEGSPETVLTEFWAEADQIDSVSELRQKLVSALADRDRLLQGLKSEQADHAQTRKSLTMALGDAIDLLSKHQPPEAAE